MTTEALSISCEDCAFDGTSACEDCVVSFLLGPPACAGGIVVDVSEARAVRMLQRAGLVPELRFRRRVS
jgi:hypothetical protein